MGGKATSQFAKAIAEVGKSLVLLQERYLV